MPNIKLPPIHSKRTACPGIRRRFEKGVKVPPLNDLQAFFENMPSIGDILVQNREKKKRKLLGQVPITIAEVKYEL